MPEARPMPALAKFSALRAFSTCPSALDGIDGRALQDRQLGVAENLVWVENGGRDLDFEFVV
jgi:hypothetical protein